MSGLTAKYNNILLGEWASKDRVRSPMLCPTCSSNLYTTTIEQEDPDGIILSDGSLAMESIPALFCRVCNTKVKLNDYVRDNLDPDFDENNDHISFRYDMKK